MLQTHMGYGVKITISGHSSISTIAEKALEVVNSNYQQVIHNKKLQIGGVPGKHHNNNIVLKKDFGIV